MNIIHTEKEIINLVLVLALALIWSSHSIKDSTLRIKGHKSNYNNTNSRGSGITINYPKRNLCVGIYIFYTPIIVIR
jgi:hypothetical protein